MPGVSATTIKSWFQYRCERKTRYEIMDAEERASVPVQADERESSWSDLGKAYERRVLRRLAGQDEVVNLGAGRDTLSEARTSAFLRRDLKAAYAPQVNMHCATPPDFLAGLTSVDLRRGYADLIHCDDTGATPAFKIIDIKATRRATVFHKAQVAFYARVLRAMLDQQRISGVIADTAEIWRIPDDGDAEGDAWQVESFALAPYLRLVDDFCSRTLPAIARARVGPGVDETFFHIYFKCEQCSYLPHCMTSIDPSLSPDRRDVSATAGLSQEAKRTLRAHAVRSVQDLAGAEGLKRIDGAGWALSRRAESLVSRAKALSLNKVLRAPEPHTFLMPPRVDVAIFLVADHDPVDDTLVSIGYRKSVGGAASDHIEVLPTSGRQAESDALVRIFTRVVADLEAVDAANQAAAASADQFAHIFVYEPSEAVNLQNAVKRHLSDARVRQGLLHMVRLFPPEDVIPEPEFRGLHHLPATALRSVVEQLYAVPVNVSYDLRQVSQALAAEDRIAAAYQPTPQFSREFSSLLSIEVARGLREPTRKSSVDVTDVEADVRVRLDAAEAVMRWLMQEHEGALARGEPPMLRLAKRPFRLQATFDPLDAGDLDILRAFELLESRSGLLQALIGLAQPARQRRDRGRCVSGLRLLGVTRRNRGRMMRFAAPPESRDAEIGPDTLGLILTDDDPDLRLDATRWREVACSLRTNRTRDDGVINVFVADQVFDGAAFQEMMRRSGGQGWCLDVSFVDINSAKADHFLTFLAGADHAA